LLKSIVICPGEELAAGLCAALNELGTVEIRKVLNRYPDAAELARTIRTYAPEVVFLSFESYSTGHAIVKFVHQEGRGIQVVAIAKNYDMTMLKDTMRLGVREYLAEPWEQASISESLSHLQAILKQEPVILNMTDKVYSFLPAKAGSGASTIALNAAGYLAEQTDRRVLLSDFDLNSGIIRFALKITDENSVVEAIEHSAKIDDELWPQLVAKCGRLDVLHAGRLNPNMRIEPVEMQNLATFMRRNYDAVIFDLSGNLERYSIELMQESKKIFLVCTTEIPSLHLAREKLKYLKTLDLDSRVSVILNRLPKRPLLSQDQVEEVLGQPVSQTFVNDYEAVHEAVTAGSLIWRETELGHSIGAFADQLDGRRSDSEQGLKSRFLERIAAPGKWLSSVERS
jgi:pilus assembly protein CpaE